MARISHPPTKVSPLFLAEGDPPRYFFGLSSNRYIQERDLSSPIREARDPPLEPLFSFLFCTMSVVLRARFEYSMNLYLTYLISLDGSVSLL